MGLVETYDYINYELADKRVIEWWFMSTPWPMLLISASYLYFIKICGPRYMRDRKPYSLKSFLTAYNIFQVFVNVWINYRLLTAGWLTHLTTGCEPMDYSLDPMALRQVDAMWWTMIVKLIDLSETAVFVFRKKDRQISFLHVYHHCTTLLITWTSVKYFGGGMCTFPILVNNCVHIIMYSYYFLSSRGPRIQKMVNFVKPYITIVQMVQFILLLLHASQALSDSCKVTTLGAAIYIANLLINLLLFINFYRQNYVQHKKTAKLE